MPGSRTIKTLTALLISMTIGAFALMVLETAPVRPTTKQLAAVSSPSGHPGRIIRSTSVLLQPIKWRNIIVHGSEAEPPDIAERCHFLIHRDGRIVGTTLWKRQLAGHHVYVPGRDFNSDSIGVCVMGDFSRSGPPRAQFAALMNLVRALQPMFSISADSVYLHSELDPYARSPGAAFPAETFNRSLYRPPR